jgi:hypothetical protein
MTLRCPVCRAENTTGPACRRCRADLSLLAAVEARRDYHVARARAALRDRDLDTATTELGQAQALHDGPDIRRLHACLLVLRQDFGPALAIYHGIA